MSEIPPPQFAAYPRAEAASDPQAADKLQALSDGYFGLSYVFLFNVVVAVGANAARLAKDLTILAFAILAVVLVIGGATYPYNKKIGYGLDWRTSGAITASVLMGLNSALCCGIIGYAIMQSFASKGMIRFGVRKRWYGVSKRDVKARIAELRGLSVP